MVVKKNSIGIKTVVLLLFLLLNLFVFYTNSLAVESDYIDFEMPIEFWDSLITYINENSGLSPNGALLNISSLHLKQHYDENLKESLKEYITSKGGDERNLIIAISNNLNNSTQGIRRLTLYFLSSNNTIGNVENDTSFYIYNASGLTYSIWNIKNYYKIEVDYNNTISSSLGQPGSSYLYWTYNSNQIDNSTTTLNNGPFFGVNQKPLNVINLRPYNSSSFANYFINGFYNINTVIEPEPEPLPSGDNGTIVNPSGEIIGNVDLSGIQNQLGNINNSINNQTDKIIENQDKNSQDIKDTLTKVPDLSGDKITSGEIINSLNFEFAEDPYANFWLELTTGLSGALTNNIRSIDVQFRDKTYKIALDNFAIQIPEFLKSFLAILSTVFIFWKMVKYWKIIIDNITSGNMDEVLEMNEEEGITDLF